MSCPRVYVVSLKTRPDRRGRMIHRLSHRHIPHTIIDAVTPNSLPYPTEGRIGTENKFELACFSSHIKAIRQFVADGEDEGFILEDDVVVHDNFAEVFAEVRKEFQDYMTFVSLLGWVIDNWSGIYIHTPNIAKAKDNMVGTQGYWLTRGRALDILEKYDKPYKDIPQTYITSETYTIRSGDAYFLLRPLVLEEANDSAIRDDQGVWTHKNFFSQHDYSIFLSGEPLEICAHVYNMKKEFNRLGMPKIMLYTEGVVQIAKQLHKANQMEVVLSRLDRAHLFAKVNMEEVRKVSDKHVIELAPGVHWADHQGLYEISRKLVKLSK